MKTKLLHCAISSNGFSTLEKVKSAIPSMGPGAVPQSFLDELCNGGESLVVAMRPPQAGKREKMAPWFQSTALVAIAAAGLFGCVSLTGQGRPIDLTRMKGEVYGIASDAAGLPIRGVIVQGEQIYDREGRPGVLSRSSVTTEMGVFTFRDLEPGTWRFCGTIRNSTLLDPCQWASAPTVHLKPGQNVVGFRLPLLQGQRIFFRIEDADKRLKVKSNGKKDSFVQVGIVEKGRFHRAIRVGDDPLGEDHMIVVPKSREVGVSIQGVNVDFDVDDKGKRTDLGKGSDAVETVIFKQSDRPKTVKVFTKAAKK